MKKTPGQIYHDFLTGEPDVWEEKNARWKKGWEVDAVELRDLLNTGTPRWNRTQPRCSSRGCDKEPTNIYITSRVYPGGPRLARYPRCDGHPMGHAQSFYRIGEEERQED
jgi:hypothetical protein